MKTLAVCATYGRIPYLGTMLATFLSQTYDDKHLVIINDDINIDLCCNYQNVSILNCNKRLNISEKRNLGSFYGSYDIIFPWDDDDIFFPERINNHLIHYEDPSVNAYRNCSCYILYYNHFSFDSVGVNNKSYRKSEFIRCGGYDNLSWGEDQNLMAKLQGFKVETDDNKRDFMYGFSNSNYHLSCKPDNLEKIAYEQLENLNLVGKKFWIEPDFEEYGKYLTLERKINETKQSIKVDITSDGKIIL